MDEQDPTVVPFAKAYGVDNLRAQEALRTAAVVLLDGALEDIRSLSLGDFLKETNASEYRRIERGGGFEAFVSIGELPERYADRYQDHHFLRDWMVTLSVVGWKLAQATPHPLTNVAEELALYVMILDAQSTVEMRYDNDEDAQAALTEFLEVALETDLFELYHDEPFEGWFYGAVHPYIADSEPSDD